MKYVLRHKEHKTYYCYDKEEKYKHFSVDGTKAYKFNTAKSAGRIRSKFKHPDRWDIIEVLQQKTK